MSDRFDPLTIFRVLNEHGVDYLIVGGVAAQAHGVSRSTLDVDVIVGRTPDNYRRLRDAVVALGAAFPATDPLAFTEIDPADEVDLARAQIARIPTQAGLLDLIRDPPGADQYPRLVARATTVTVRDVVMRVIGVDDLISMKRASGRPKDLADIAELTSGDSDGPPPATPR